MKSLFLLSAVLLPFFFAGCQSMDSSREEEYKEAAIDMDIQEREIASFQKPSSVFDRSNFEFLSEKMKKVVKNYKRMRKKLSQIEKKLDIFLAEFRRTRDEFLSTETAEREEEAVDTLGDNILNEALEGIESEKSGDENEPDLTTETVSSDSSLFEEDAPVVIEEESARPKSASPDGETEPEEEDLPSPKKTSGAKDKLISARPLGRNSFFS